jgi:adenine phosphoribosyltransferase
MDDLKKTIRAIPDFPIKNITFRDVTTLMQDAAMFKKACDLFTERYQNQRIDKVVGIDARGFIFGSVLAYNLGVGFVPVRKKGKLPYKTISEKYKLEYGSSEVEIHQDSILHGERVVVIDDLIATGGTVAATVKLVEKLGGIIIECAFLVELPDLKGRDALSGHNIFSLISFDGD